MPVRSLSKSMIGSPVFGHHDRDIGLAEALDDVKSTPSRRLSVDLLGISPVAKAQGSNARKGVGKPEACAHGMIDKAAEERSDILHRPKLATLDDVARTRDRTGEAVKLLFRREVLTTKAGKDRTRRPGNHTSRRVATSPTWAPTSIAVRESMYDEIYCKRPISGLSAENASAAGATTGALWWVAELWPATVVVSERISASRNLYAVRPACRAW